MGPKTIVYIDGFNFYYGAVRGTRFKWLNLETCFSRLRQNDQLQRVHYFTAIIDGGQKRARQKQYLRALATLPLVDVILGKFKNKQIKCRVRGCAHAGSRIFETTEEKRTDVNIALQLVDDAYHDRADHFVIVSGDSDLVPALEMVKSYCPGKRLTVYVPSRNRVRGAATELRAAADKSKTFPQALLKVSQLPASVPDGRGGMIQKPATW